MKVKLLSSVTLLCVFLIRLHKCQKCPPSFFGKACRLKCHCLNEDNDCQEGQGGRGGCTFCAEPYSQAALCQRLNAAKGQPTLQSSSTSSKESALAADGDVITCSSLSNYTWWQVDLGKLRVVTWIDVYNGYTLDDRHLGYSVYVTNSSLNAEFNASLPRLEDKHCYTDRPGGNRSSVCTSAIIGRYVIIYQRPPRVLELCEVEIHECTDYTFGRYCHRECNCNNVTEICDKVTGKCLSGCPAGFTGVDCHTECVDGKFGEACNSSCNCKSEDEVCAKDDGRCSSGCAKGFTGLRCDQTIAAADTHGSLLPAVVALAAVMCPLIIVVIVLLVRCHIQRAYANKNKIEVGANTYKNTRIQRHSGSDYDDIQSISPLGVWSTAMMEHANNVMLEKWDVADRPSYYEVSLIDAADPTDDVDAAGYVSYRQLVADAYKNIKSPVEVPTTSLSNPTDRSDSDCDFYIPPSYITVISDESANGTLSSVTSLSKDKETVSPE